MMDKEIIKEFLKPNCRKVLVATYLYLAGLYSSFFPYLRFMPFKVCSYINGVFTCHIELFSPTQLYDEHLLVELWISLIILAIPTYLISCLIIYAYNKFKNKK